MTAAGAPSSSTIRVIYRSYGGNNLKDRPSYFSKQLALHSMLRAAEAIDCEVVFLNDGPMPEDLLQLMRGRGEIVTLPGMGLFGSVLAAMRLPLERGWEDESVVYFCEDDYLHTADSLVHLKAAAQQLRADYFALYATLPEEREQGKVSDWTHRQPSGWTADEADVDGVTWVRVLGTTSTFGGRVRALRKDVSILRQAKLPHKNMFRDWDVSLAYQGFRPYHWSDLFRAITLRGPGSLKDKVRGVVLVPFQAAMNLRSRRRPGNRHVLMAASPNLATHLETEYLASGRNWEEVARDTEEWTRERSTKESSLPSGS